MKKIIQIGNPILEKKSSQVKDPKDSKVQAVIKDLVLLCQKNEEKTVGLSAPQIGKNLRIFLARRVDIEEKHKDGKLPKNTKLWEIMINPKIEIIGDKTSILWEGCLSVEEGEIFGPVERPSEIKVQYLDEKGKKKELHTKDFLAHIILHEFDHLEGKLFIGYVVDPSNLWKGDDLDKYIDKHGDFPAVI